MPHDAPDLLTYLTHVTWYPQAWWPTLHMSHDNPRPGDLLNTCHTIPSDLVTYLTHVTWYPKPVDLLNTCHMMPQTWWPTKLMSHDTLRPGDLLNTCHMIPPDPVSYLTHVTLYPQTWWPTPVCTQTMSTHTTTSLTTGSLTATSSEGSTVFTIMAKSKLFLQIKKWWQLMFCFFRTYSPFSFFFIILFISRLGVNLSWKSIHQIEA